MKVSIDDVKRKIVQEQFIQPFGTNLTLCVLTLKNGFSATGEFVSADPDDFNEQLGQKIARAKAIEKAMELEGYLLADNLASFPG